VYVATATGGTRVLWEGDAVAVALDGDQAWIAARAPLAVIDRVALASGEVTLRVPLPLELDGPSLQLVVGQPIPSPRQHAVVAYAHDRPLDAALVIAPAAGVALPLHPHAGASPGVADLDATPALLVPPGKTEDGRLRLGDDPGATFGRIAACPGGAFLAIERRGGDLELRRFGAPVTGSREVGFAAVHLPEGWSTAVQAVGWDADGVVLASSRDVLRLRRGGATELDGGATAGDHLRHGLNYVLAGTTCLVETTTAITINTVLVTPVVPLAPMALALGSPLGCGAMLTAPLWAPTWIAFGGLH
jgi:hypothetical protein